MVLGKEKRGEEGGWGRGGKVILSNLALIFSDIYRDTLQVENTDIF